MHLVRFWHKADITAVLIHVRFRGYSVQGFRVVPTPSHQLRNFPLFHRYNSPDNSRLAPPAPDRKMIDEDRLTIKRNRHGAPKPPDKFARDIVAALLYEKRSTNTSKDAFKEIAATLSMSHQSVRQAVTRWRKTSDHRAK